MCGVRPAGGDELQKALAQDCRVSVDYTQPANERQLLNTGGERVWKGFPAGTLRARSTRTPWVPCEGSQVATATTRQHSGSHTPPHSRAGVTAGPWEDVCLSSQLRAGCALQINSSFYTYSFCLCTQPARQRPGGAFSRCCLWCGFYRWFLFNPERRGVSMASA